MPKIIPVILCGGVGSRLWPLSRQSLPKQFLKLNGEKSLLQETVLRVSNKRLFKAPILACNEAYRFRVLDELCQLEIEPVAVLLEPEPKNTAPAIALAAELAQRISPGDLVLVLPSDGLVAETEPFLQSVRVAAKLAKQGLLIAFGVSPQTPSTAYGYIRKGEAIGGGYRIQQFIEKPALAKARQFLRNGDCFWNCGMFLFDPTVYLTELARFEPSIACGSTAALAISRHDGVFMRPDAGLFVNIPSKSIDYAVMERTERAAVVPIHTFWSDIGNWSALWEVAQTDAAGNSVRGDVVAQDVSSSYLRAEHKLLVAVGLKNTVVVETRDAVLVCNKAHAGKIAEVVSQLKLQNRREVQSYPQEFRPWGSYENYNSDPNCIVKRIIVDPFSKLSLQLHRHRSEHWIVIKGTALVTCGNERRVLREGESAFIPKGTKHRLENPGDTPLEIIEIQTGTHLSEEDIIRFEDGYGRIDGDIALKKPIKAKMAVSGDCRQSMAMLHRNS